MRMWECGHCPRNQVATCREPHQYVITYLDHIHLAAQLQDGALQQLQLRLQLRVLDRAICCPCDLVHGLQYTNARRQLRAENERKRMEVNSVCGSVGMGVR